MPRCRFQKQDSSSLPLINSCELERLLRMIHASWTQECHTRIHGLKIQVRARTRARATIFWISTINLPQHSKLVETGLILDFMNQNVRPQKHVEFLTPVEKLNRTMREQHREFRKTPYPLHQSEFDHHEQWEEEEAEPTAMLDDNYATPSRADAGEPSFKPHKESTKSVRFAFDSEIK